MTPVKYWIEPNQIADVQNNTPQLSHDWSWYVATSQTDYELDGVGNRKTVIRDGQTETYVTNSVNEYIYINNQRLMYDANGNLTQWDGKTLHYNHNNQLVQVDVGDDTYAFRYDALGRKLAGKVKLFGLWYWRCGWHDGQRVIMEETLGVMPAERFYVYGNLIDEVICEWHSMNGGWWQQWYLTDALGSVYVLTGNSGNIVEAYQYSIYGEPKVYAPDGSPRDLTDYDNRLLFTSREYIWQLHLYYYRFRWYCPIIGCFVARDPARLTSEYGYVAAAPVSYCDPIGLLMCIRGQKEALVSFVNTISQCGLPVRLAGRCNCPQGYTQVALKKKMAMQKPSDPEKAFFAKTVREIVTDKKRVAFYHIVNRAGIVFGSFGAKEQTIDIGDILDYRGLTRNLPIWIPSPCELLLHEIYEQWYNVVHGVGRYGPCHTAALRKQNEMRRSRGQGSSALSDIRYLTEVALIKGEGKGQLRAVVFAIRILTRAQLFHILKVEIVAGNVKSVSIKEFATWPG